MYETFLRYSSVSAILLYKCPLRVTPYLPIYWILSVVPLVGFLWQTIGDFDTQEGLSYFSDLTESLVLPV